MIKFLLLNQSRNPLSNLHRVDWELLLIKGTLLFSLYFSPSSSPSVGEKLGVRGRRRRRSASSHPYL
jgi:hypothetical protein